VNTIMVLVIKNSWIIHEHEQDVTGLAREFNVSFSAQCWVVLAG
jgi:hypothetical protein